METETVKLLKALPNMLWKVMLTVVVATKYSQGIKDLRDPILWHPIGLNLSFIILYSCAVPLEIYRISSHVSSFLTSVTVHDNVLQLSRMPFNGIGR